MSFRDRPYYRDEPASNPLGQHLGGKSVVTWLLIINVVIFLLDSILTGSRRAGWLSPLEHGSFSIDKAIFGVQIWRWVTYQFLHGDIFHILFNMIVLYFFGPMMERWWGSRRFIAFYLISGLGGALLFTLFAFVPGLLHVSRQSQLVGASGSLFGVLVGCAVVAPRQQVRLLFPPIPMQMRTLVLIFLGIAVLSVLAGAANDGGDAAHLGGAAIGFLLIKQPGLLGFAEGSRLADWTRNRQRRKQQRQTQREDEEDKQIDRILAKVSEQGLHSLSEREKRILKRATDRQKRAG